MYLRTAISVSRYMYVCKCVYIYIDIYISIYIYVYVCIYIWPTIWIVDINANIILKRKLYNEDRYESTS